MRILTLVMTYNEASNIGRLVPEILKHVPTTAVLVVDDNSPDGTAEVVRGLGASDPRVEVLTRTTNRGYGSATIAGMQHGVRNGYDVIATLDADFSHDPAELPRVIEGLAAADVSIGSRYVGGIRVLNWGVRRLLLSLAANTYVRFLIGLSCIDCTSGFRAYRVATLKSVALERISSTGYVFLPELLFALDQVTIREVPICYTERRVGESKMGRRVIAEGMLRPWVLLCRRLVRSVRRSLLGT
ncbi:MAG: polyprenol monophosphomannose synthase [Vicinamibacterales bacterium]